MNIVYAMTRNVYEWILPSIRSLAEHHPDARVFILAEDDELPFELPMAAEVINVSGQTFFPKDSPNYKNAFSYINLLKVRYPSILPVDKVIHLDIDTIVTDDLTELWETDLTGKWFAAVNEYKGSYKPFGAVYFNCGVMVINLKELKNSGFETDMQEYLNSFRQPWADQDAWNKYGFEEGKIVPLEVRWNENQMTGQTDKPAIVHFCGYRDWWTRTDMERSNLLRKYKFVSDSPLKILIAVPTFENIYPDTFKSIYNLDKGDHHVDFDFFRGYDVAKARNLIAKATLERGYDYVLMVDNDEVLPPDALTCLIEGRDSVVVGYCLSRPKNNTVNSTGRTTAFKFNGQHYVKEDAYTGEELKAFRDKGISRIKIRGSGLGCALIHRSVFEKMKYPYFKWTEYEKGTQLSEDLFFSERVNKEMYVDTRVDCGHLMRHVDYV